MSTALDRPTTSTRARRSRFVALLAAVVLALAALAGCADDTRPATRTPSARTARSTSRRSPSIVGDQKGGSKALLQAAGLLDDVEYEIEWKEFTSGPPLLEAMNAGRSTSAASATPRRCSPPRAAGVPGRPGRHLRRPGDAIVVPPGSDAQAARADLKGKTVAVAQGSSANYHLLAQLENAGLTYDDVEVKYLQPADALAAFSGGHVDAWAIWEPFTSQAEQDAGAQVIADGTTPSTGSPSRSPPTAALDDPATTAALEDYLERISRAQVWSQTHQQEWADTWAEETGLAPATTLAAVTKREIKGGGEGGGRGKAGGGGRRRRREWGGRGGEGGRGGWRGEGCRSGRPPLISRLLTAASVLAGASPVSFAQVCPLVLVGLRPDLGPGDPARGSPRGQPWWPGPRARPSRPPGR